MTVIESIKEESISLSILKALIPDSEFPMIIFAPLKLEFPFDNQMIKLFA